MFVIQTYLAPSAIHGIGVFSTGPVPAGTLMWAWHEGVDQELSPEQVAALPPVCQAWLKRYCWREHGMYRISLDQDRYVNHAEHPNCVFVDGGSRGIASRDIAADEEITQDYRNQDDEFGNPEFGYEWLSATSY